MKVSRCRNERQVRSDWRKAGRSGKKGCQESLKRTFFQAKTFSAETEEHVRGQPAADALRGDQPAAEEAGGGGRGLEIPAQENALGFEDVGGNGPQDGEQGRGLAAVQAGFGSGHLQGSAQQRQVVEQRNGKSETKLKSSLN